MSNNMQGFRRGVGGPGAENRAIRPRSYRVDVRLEFEWNTAGGSYYR